MWKTLLLSHRISRNLIHRLFYLVFLVFATFLFFFWLLFSGFFVALFIFLQSGLFSDRKTWKPVDENLPEMLF